MNAIQMLASQLWVERLGWTLVHFVWQGAVIATLYAAARLWMGRGLSSSARYLISCSALAVMMAAPLVTWIVLQPSDPGPAATHLAVAASAASPALTTLPASCSGS